jgi:hypothetical protein
METKIRVMVNDILNQIGSCAIRNVIFHDNEFELVPVSVTAFATKERPSPENQTKTMRVDQRVIRLIEPEEVAEKCISGKLFNYGRPDVVVDCNPETPFLSIIPDCLMMNTSFVFFIPVDVEKEVSRLKRDIKNSGVNIFIFDKAPSEKEVQKAIYFLHQKQLARDLGRVFL